MIDANNGTDFLGGSNKLRDARITRECFDPTNGMHLESLRSFLSTGNWGVVQFYPEAPYLTVPETVLRKMASAGLSNLGY